MRLTQLSARKAIVTAAVASAAILLPAVALASSSGASAPASTSSCATSGLVVWMNTQGSQYAGGAYYTLNFTNLSGHTCTLDGFPGVSAVNLKGHRIGAPAGWNPVTRSLITIASGATATASLQVSDPANYGTECFLPGPAPSPGHGGKLPTAAGLRVYPPNQKASKIIPFPLGACASSVPVWLHVGPVQ